MFLVRFFIPILLLRAAVAGAVVKRDDAASALPSMNKSAEQWGVPDSSGGEWGTWGDWESWWDSLWGTGNRYSRDTQRHRQTILTSLSVS